MDNNLNKNNFHSKPLHPDVVYINDGWNGWGDFLGTGNTVKKDFINYKEAKKIIDKQRKNGKPIKSVKEYAYFYKDKGKLYKMPSSPDIAYKGKGWVNWKSFLGTKIVSTKNKKFVNYKKAKLIVKRMQRKGVKINNLETYIILCHAHPEYNLPVYPNEKYKNEGWVNWDVFLNKEAIDYKKAKDLMHKLRKLGKPINNIREYRSFCRNNKNKYNIPLTPNVKYKNKGWTNWGDYLGTGNYIRTNFINYEEAKKLISKLRKDGKPINTIMAYKKFCHKKCNSKYNLPIEPYNSYKNKGWTNWGEFLGTGKPPRKRSFMSYTKAKNLMHKLRQLGKPVNSMKEYDIFYRSNIKKYDLPSAPFRTYKEEWVNWPVFLGKK